MSVTIGEAYGIARRAIPEDVTISEAYDAGSWWVFAYGIRDAFGHGDDEVYPIPGYPPLGIDKQTGKARMLDIPSLPHELRDEPPTPDEMAMESAREVPLPVA